MTIRHLKIFISVAENQSMSAAAAKLFLSQPTVSQAIRELEDHYEVLLFDRLAKRLHITPAGQELLGYAYQAVGQFDQLENRMKKSRHRESLRIGGTITVGACLLPNIMSDFGDLMPHAGTFTFVGNTRTIEGKLIRSELDIALVEGEIRHPDLISIPCVRDFLVLGCSHEHPFASREVVRIHELNEQPFIMREQGSGTRALFDAFIQRHNLRIYMAWEATAPELFRNAMLNNHCLSVISVRLLEQDIQSGQIRIFRTCTDEFERSFNLVYHKDKVHTPSMDAIRDIIVHYRQPDWLNQVPVGILQE
ncbi:MAG: LysR family transcriptional regulator [Clostridiales bacterium]|nr:LysR family transcriptional regulator [Clostridiales bacterium]